MGRLAGDQLAVIVVPAPVNALDVGRQLFRHFAFCEIAAGATLLQLAVLVEVGLAKERTAARVAERRSYNASRWM